MSMIKVVSPAGWDFAQPSACLVKLARAGLVGGDRRDFIKRAGASAELFLPQLDATKFAGDEALAHLIALGAYERWSINKNGDFFKRATCERDHPSFVKLARFYRGHDNKDPAKSYGVVKASAYNDEMHRVELLVALNAEKSAAARNGGLVADREVAKLARDNDLGVSMAGSVPHDVCSFCGNQARTRADYCTAATCKAGGCRDNLAQLVKVGGDLHHLGVDNPYISWFDISNVDPNPADRTAYAHRADYLTKAAAAGGFFGVGGARVAEELGLSAYDHLPDAAADDVAWQVKIAVALGRLQRQVRRHWGGDAQDQSLAQAFAAEVYPPVDVTKLGADTAAALAALADEEVLLSLDDFAALTKQGGADRAAALVPGALDAMCLDGSLERRLLNNPHDPADKQAGAALRRQAAALEVSHGLRRQRVEDRAVRAAVRGLGPAPRGAGTVKAAADAHELARAYAAYQVAALYRMAKKGGDLSLTARCVCVHNLVR